MIKKDTYIINVTPFRILEKDSKQATVISDKGKYYKINSSCIPNLNIGDYFCKSVLIGEGHVQTNYFQFTKKQRRQEPFNNCLDQILFKFRKN